MAGVPLDSSIQEARNLIPPRRSPFALLARASKTRTPTCVVQFAAGCVYDSVGQLGDRGLLPEPRHMPWQKQVGHPRQPQQIAFAKNCDAGRERRQPEGNHEQS